MPINNIIIQEEDDGIRLDRWFKRHQPNYPFSQIAKLIRTGQIRIDGKRVKVETRIVAGSQLKFPSAIAREAEELPESVNNYRGERLAQALLRDILYKDDSIIVLNKPYGLPTQGGTKVSVSLDDALPYLVDEGCERPRLVHRLDRETSGLLLLARSVKIAHKLGDLFKQREIEKSYLAILIGVPQHKAGTINYSLKKEVKGNYESVTKSEKGVTAITDYKVVDYALGEAALVQMWPRTGRMHQLRAHSKIIGHPIAGDHKYWLQEKPLPTGVVDKLHLIAHKLQFQLDGKTYNFVAPIPEFFQQTLKHFGLAINEVR